MKPSHGDLVNSYRTAVQWGYYEEAAKIHRQMIGLPPGEPDPALTFELRGAEKAPQSPGLFATLRAIFRRNKSAARPR